MGVQSSNMSIIPRVCVWVVRHGCAVLECEYSPTCVYSPAWVCSPRI
ncbi:unnamed protein product [Thelazia callipaeda]|uniref:Uncharacterized protein n=1 Tax=Thelazia callipaeda TaxID=103827 RepID=A0A0N5D9T7_THECL|nr:unnamed protein product [Thelazia callipaeda]